MGEIVAVGSHIDAAVGHGRRRRRPLQRPRRHGPNDRAIHPREPRQTRRHPHPARALPTELAPPGLIKMRSVSPPLHTSPIESAALRSRVIALENELAEAKTLAANPSSVELAALRSKSISLEAELELAKTDGAKSEEAMGGMLRMQRAMSSAQKAKITQLHEQNAALEAQIARSRARSRKRERPRRTRTVPARSSGAKPSDSSRTSTRRWTRRRRSGNARTTQLCAGSKRSSHKRRSSRGRCCWRTPPRSSAGPPSARP